MNFHRLLVAIDGSQSSRDALDIALALAKAVGANLLLCSVVDAATFAGFAPPSREMDQNIVFGEIEAKKLLEHALDKAKKSGVAAETKLLLGTPSDEIVAYAEEISPDAIVMGTHGRGGLGRVLMGSVAESVLRHASCPVMTIRHRAKR